MYNWEMLLWNSYDLFTIIIITATHYNDDDNGTDSNGNIYDGDKWCFTEIRRIYTTPDRISN